MTLKRPVRSLGTLLPPRSSLLKRPSYRLWRGPDTFVISLSFRSNVDWTHLPHRERAELCCAVREATGAVRGHADQDTVSPSLRGLRHCCGHGTPTETLRFAGIWEDSFVPNLTVLWYRALTRHTSSGKRHDA